MSAPSSAAPRLQSPPRKLPFYALPPKLQNLLALRVSEGRGPSVFGLLSHEHTTSQWLTRPSHRDYVDDMRSWLVHLYGCGEKLCPRAFETKRIRSRTLGEQTCECGDWSASESEGSHHIGDGNGEVGSGDGCDRLEFWHERNEDGGVYGYDILPAVARKVSQAWGSEGTGSTRSCEGSDFTQRHERKAPNQIIVDVRKPGARSRTESSVENEEHPAVTVEVRIWE
ncbi:hypothetical protein BKA65DRAFT_547581 [Rhexocercosporidium sp. MPI-PUGE-AT-0058]|nr:hypothetical protein BKA65DRAFT_547581 [Rhexocercosporidium sp. MPI-PUGE-AT-0058]